jgi:hypothetical protein
MGIVHGTGGVRYLVVCGIFQAYLDCVPDLMPCHLRSDWWKRNSVPFSTRYARTTVQMEIGPSGRGCDNYIKTFVPAT